ncbi:ZPR1 zinc finger domain-containing protein [archaeon]|nr:ZPR1 zinc finger domain-containing protein [archaeon]
MEEIKGQLCPVCGKKELTLREEEMDIPYFGLTFLFSMDCPCGFSKSDVESAEKKDPVKITFNVEGVGDLNARVIKSGSALVKISQLKMSMEPGENSEGFVSNVEGLLGKFEKILEGQRDSSDDPLVCKKAKKLLKKIWKVKCGDVALKIVIEDKNGNSAIISEKAKVEKLK